MSSIPHNEDWREECRKIEEEFATRDAKKLWHTDDNVDGWMDLPMPDVRGDWKTASEKNELKGCGLHKNFTYDELCELEQSLRERRILADVPTPDVIEFRDQQKKTAYRHKRNFRRVDASQGESQESLKTLKDKLKQEILRELLDELKSAR